MREKRRRKLSRKVARKPDSSTLINPFGEPDGSRTDLAQIQTGFVHFDNQAIWGGIASEPSDFKARIIVGRKGAGKTMFLRRLHASADSSSSYETDEIHATPPSTEMVLRLSQQFNESELRGVWSSLWACAIDRALVSQLLRGRLSQYVTETAHQQLSDFQGGLGGRLLPNFLAVSSPYTQISSILNDYGNRKALQTYLEDARWRDLETIISAILSGCSPLFVFLDGLDEFFEYAPKWWMKCQEGLFDCSVRLLRTKLANRFHLFVSLRDVVYGSALQSQHAARFAGDSHIRLLNWRKEAIDHFLSEKIRRLRIECFVNPNSSKSIGDWLGITSLKNEKRNVCEPISQYLLRHTRLLPRDIVILGNRLSACILTAKQTGTAEGIDNYVRREVHDAAALFGKEQFRICANEIVSSYMPRCVMKDGYEAYVSNQDYTEGVAEALKKVVCRVGIDRFSREELLTAREEAQRSFGNDPFSAMWRNGLIGFVDGPSTMERHIFYNFDSLNSFNLPDHHAVYVFHPTVIDATGIASVGPRPVVPYQ